MLSIYPACFFADDDGYSVVFPDLNNTATCGDTFDEAMEMAVDCLAGYLYACQEDGDSIPKPSRPDQINPEAVAKELDFEGPVDKAFVSIVSVDVAAYARDHFIYSVEKTVKIPAWLDATVQDRHIDISQVLQDALKERIGIV